jgi:phage-related minor tail protein
MIKSVLLEVGVINKVRSKINNINRATSFNKVGSAINRLGSKVRSSLNRTSSRISNNRVTNKINHIGSNIKSKVNKLTHSAITKTKNYINSPQFKQRYKETKEAYRSSLHDIL